MIYKGIETENKYINGSWFTYFKRNGEILKTVEWNHYFGDEDIQSIITNQIAPFI